MHSGNNSVKNLCDLDKERFISEFSQYHHASKKCIKGLVRRRFEELNIFFSGTYKRISNFSPDNFPYPIPECAKVLF